MKLLSLNTMSGGFNAYEYETPFPQRIELLKELINGVDAEIVSLVDTFRWDEIYSSEDLKELFNYKHAYCINLEDDRLIKLGHNNGITVLSNIEIDKFETINLGTRNCVKTIFQMGGKPVHLYSTYLDDLSEDTRLKQIDTLLKTTSADVGTLIVGDLNTFSPEDKEKRSSLVNWFLAENPKHEGIRKQLEDMARAEVIQKLFDNGFKDAAINKEATFPTKLLNLVNEPILRLDYCFYKNIAIKGFTVISNSIAKKTSDHFPIAVSF